MAPPKGKFLVKLNATLYAILLNELMDRPMSCAEMAEMVGMDTNGIRKWVKTLYRKNVLHVAAWEATAHGRINIACYQLGRGPDVKKPTLTRKQRNERRREDRRGERLHSALLSIATNAT